MRVLTFVLAVPANDSVFDNLIEMRQRLGWVTDIPRHGPDCKKDMGKLSDKPLTEKVSFLSGLLHLSDTYLTRSQEDMWMALDLDEDDSASYQETSSSFLHEPLKLEMPLVCSLIELCLQGS